MNDPIATAPEPLRFEASYVTGPDYPGRFTRAYFAYNYSRPRSIVYWSITLTACIVLLTLAAFGDAGAWLFPTVFLSFFILAIGLSYFAIVRQIRKRIPAGSILSIGFRGETMVMRTPQVTSEVAYSLYRSCARRGRFVVLRQRGSRATSLLPAEIFTDESLAFLSSKIGASTPGI